METNGIVINELPLVLDIEIKHIAQLDEFLESIKKICAKHNHVPYIKELKISLKFKEDAIYQGGNNDYFNVYPCIIYNNVNYDDMAFKTY